MQKLYDYLKGYYMEAIPYIKWLYRADKTCFEKGIELFVRGLEEKLVSPELPPRTIIGVVTRNTLYLAINLSDKYVPVVLNKHLIGVYDVKSLPDYISDFNIDIARVLDRTPASQNVTGACREISGYVDIASKIRDSMLKHFTKLMTYELSIDRKVEPVEVKDKFNVVLDVYDVAEKLYLAHITFYSGVTTDVTVDIMYGMGNEVSAAFTGEVLAFRVYGSPVIGFDRCTVFLKAPFLVYNVVSTIVEKLGVKIAPV